MLGVVQLSALFGVIAAVATFWATQREQARRKRAIDAAQARLDAERSAADQPDSA